MARAWYRIRQFWQGLAARVTPADLQQVTRLLPPAAMPLFTQMTVDAQRHSLNVLASIHAAGYDDPDLAVAALLHDCGKVAAAQGGVRLGLWWRGPLVLLDACWPSFAARWALSQPGCTIWSRLRYALYVQREHPTIGAAWAAAAGCRPLSCWLIAHHQQPVTTLVARDFAPLVVNAQVGSEQRARTLLAALQAADNGN